MPTVASSSEVQTTVNATTLSPDASRVPEGDEISLLDLLIALAERKRAIMSITCSVAVVSAVIALLLPPRYAATVVLLPPQQNTSMGAAMTSQLGSMGAIAAFAGGGFGLKNPNDMYVAMFKSRTVEDAMIQRFDLMQEYKARYLSDARKTFEERANVDGSGKDGLIHITVEDRDARRAAAIANGYVDQFRTQSQHLAITEASQRRLFFEQQLEQAKNNLASAEEAMKRTEQKTGVIQLDSQARALIESATLLRAQIAAKEVQIQGMQTYATGENSQLIQAQQELATLRQQLAKLGGSEDTGGELIVPKGKVPEAGLEYIRTLRDVKYYETIFEILARQFEVAKLDEAKQGALIQVVDSAVPPEKRSFPRRSLIVLGATAVGFLVATVLALLQAAFQHIKRDPGSAEKLGLLRRSLRLRGSATR